MLKLERPLKYLRVGTIAGCMVTSGKISVIQIFELFEKGCSVYRSFEFLKTFKDDVKEVAKGYDCGLQIKNYNDIRS